MEILGVTRFMSEERVHVIDCNLWTKVWSTNGISLESSRWMMSVVPSRCQSSVPFCNAERKQ